jgi:hypothetical protein
LGWFARQAAGRNTDEVSREHARYLRAAGVDRAMDALAGPFGVRRFLVRFLVRGARVRVDSIGAIPLSFGGGPPPEDTTGRTRRQLEQSLGRLHTNMGAGPRWSRGAMAYLRDASGRTDLVASFDDDADGVSLDGLPRAQPPGHPLEAPETLHMLDSWEGPVEAVRHRSTTVVPDWDEWEIKDDRALELHWSAGPQGSPPARIRRLRCRTLATWHPRWSRFTWHTGDPLFPESVFAADAFPSTMDAAMELTMVATARLGAAWLTVLQLDDAGTVLLVAVMDEL